MNDTKTEWYIIVNPHAGSGKTMEEWTKAQKWLAELDIQYTAAYTGYKSHGKGLAEEAAIAGYRRFLAVGGDGSVHELFTGVLSFCENTGVSPNDFHLGVIPIGSGNDWIKSLGIPHDTSTVVELVGKERFVTQDVARVRTDRDSICYMANIGGVGFDSHVCERVNTKKERGYRSKSIYVKSLIHTILHLKRINVAVIGDDKLIYSGPCFSIALGNGRFSGGGMLQTALADSDDGLLDVLVVPAVSIFRIFKELHRVFDGSTPDSACMIYGRCRCLKIVPLDSKSADIVEIDGEIEGRMPLEIDVTGDKVNVLCGTPR